MSALCMAAFLDIILFKIINWILLLLSHFKLRNQGTQKLRNLPRVTHIVSGRARIWTQEVCILPTTHLTMLFFQSKVGFAKISVWLVITFYLLPNVTMPALNTRLSNGDFQSSMNCQCWKYTYIHMYILKTALL